MNTVYRLQVVMDLMDRLSGPAMKAAQTVQRLQELTEKVALAQRQMVSGLSVAGAGMTLAAPLLLATRAAMQFEDAFADVRKVLDAPGPALAQLQRDLIGLTRSIPMTARQLTEIAAAAGQAGIPLAEIVRFTQDAARVGVAFGISAGQAGDALAKLRNILSLSQEGVLRLADSINHLSNNMAATAPEILEVVRRVGGMGKLVGLSGQQIAALASSMIALGTAPEVAATGLNALMQRLATASAQPKDFQEALARVGYTATSLQAALRRDAAGAIMDFLARLRSLPDQLPVLSALFGREYSDDIAKLVGSLDTLRNAMRLVADQGAYAGSVLAEFQNRNQTLQNQLILLRNAVERLWISVGNTLLPVVTPLVERVTSLINRIGDLLERFPILRGAVVGVSAALGGLLVVGGLALTTLGAIGWATAQARIGLLTLQGVLPTVSRHVRLLSLNLALLRAQLASLGGPLGVLRLAMMGMGRAALWAGRSVMLLGRALVATPLGLVATALVAIGSALVQVWRHSEAFRSGILSTLASVRGSLAPVLAELRALRDAVAAAFRPLAGVMEASLGGVSRVLDRILYGVFYGLGFLVGLMEGLVRRLAPILGEGLAGVLKMVRGFVETLAGLLTLDMPRAMRGIQTMWEGLRAVLMVPIRLGGVVWDVVRTSLTAALGWVQARLGDLWSLLARPLRLVPVAWEALQSSLTSALGWAGAKLGDLWGLLARPLRLVPVAWEALQSSLTAALGWVRGLVPELQNIGRMLVEGLVSGIRSMASLPMDAIRGLGQGVVATLKGILGIRSPSTVFASLGVMTALGLVQGLETMTPRVVRAVQGLVPPVQNVPVRVTPLVGTLPMMNLQARVASLTDLPAVPALPAPQASASAQPPRPSSAGVTQVVRIERLELPGVRSADEFLEALKRLLLPYMEA